MVHRKLLHPCNIQISMATNSGGSHLGYGFNRYFFRLRLTEMLKTN